MLIGCNLEEGKFLQATVFVGLFNDDRPMNWAPTTPQRRH